MATEEEKLDIEDIKDPLEEADPVDEAEDLDLEEAVSEEEATVVEESEPVPKEVKTKKVAAKKRETKKVTEKTEPVEPEVEQKDALEEALTSASMPEEPVAKKRRTGLKTFFVIIVTILITAAAVLGGVYWWTKRTTVSGVQNTEESTQKETAEEQPAEKMENEAYYVNSAVGLNLRKEPSLTAEKLVIIPNGTKITILEEKDGWVKTSFDGKEGWVSKDFLSKTNPFVYKNDQYGFGLTLPESWSGYKVFPIKLKDFGLMTYYFALPTTDETWVEPSFDKGYASFFALTVMEKTEWEEVKSQEGPKPTLIKESGGKAYVWSPAQAGPKDLAVRVKEIQTIINSFKLS